MEKEERRRCVRGGRGRTIKGGGEWRGRRKGGGIKRDDQVKIPSLTMSFLN